MRQQNPVKDRKDACEFSFQRRKISELKFKFLTVMRQFDFPAIVPYDRINQETITLLKFFWLCLVLLCCQKNISSDKPFLPPPEVKKCHN